jgi:pimeloyl-ACP methyl ester carboxylesterase
VGRVAVTADPSSPLSLHMTEASCRTEGQDADSPSAPCLTGLSPSWLPGSISPRPPSTCRDNAPARPLFGQRLNKVAGPRFRAPPWPDGTGKTQPTLCRGWTGHCDLPGLSVYYQSTGRGRPFVMLHGSPSDHTRARSHVEPAFRGRAGWQRIYPDLPGRGRTPGTSRVHDLDDYLGVVLEFVDAVVAGENFALGGISFGAYLALGIARRRTAQLDGLLLSVPEINHSPLEERRDRARQTPSILGPPPRDSVRNGYVEDTAWLEGLAFHDVRLPLYRSARPFRRPSLFLFGRQDADFWYQTYARMLPGFSRATFAILDGAGHRLWTDRNELACALVRDWVDRMESISSAPPRGRRSSIP